MRNNKGNKSKHGGGNLIVSFSLVLSYDSTNDPNNPKNRRNPNNPRNPHKSSNTSNPNNLSNTNNPRNSITGSVKSEDGRSWLCIVYHKKYDKAWKTRKTCKIPCIHGKYGKHGKYDNVLYTTNMVNAFYTKKYEKTKNMEKWKTLIQQIRKIW